MQNQLTRHAIFILLFAVLWIGCEEAKYCETTCGDIALIVDTNYSKRKVLIIGIDGFRSEGMQDTITPFLHELSTDKETYFTREHIVETQTFSGPNWASICTGVHADKHSVTDNAFSNNRFSDYPHFFHYLKEAKSSLNTISIVNWTPINETLVSHADHAPLQDMDDAEVYSRAEEALLIGSPVSPDVLFIHLDSPDHEGHSYGFSSQIPEYAAALSEIDTYVKDLFAIIENKRTNGEEWLILIVSDHGGDGKGHGGGGSNEFSNKTIFYANSPDVVFIDNYNCSQVDVAPTILDYMGITHCTFDCKKDGNSVILLR